MDQLQSLVHMPAHLGAGSSAGQQHSNVYIRGLPLEANESLLASLFQPFGTVQSVRIFRSNQNPAKAPFAFVKLESAAEADAAIAQLNGMNIGGSLIEVRLADKDAGMTTCDRRPPPSDNIYCKNLPAGFGDNELRQLFSPFGSVSMCRVLHQGDSTGQGGAALVRLTSMDDATRAVQALQGHRVLGALHPLIIRFADSAEIKAKKQAKQSAGGTPLPLPTLPLPLPPMGPGTAGPHGGPSAVRPTMQQLSPPGRFNPYGGLVGSGISQLMPPPLPLPSPPSSAFGMQLGGGPMGGMGPMGGYYSGAGAGQGLPLGPLGLPGSVGMPSQPDPALFMSPSDYSLGRPGQQMGGGQMGGASMGLAGPSSSMVSAMAVASLYVKNLPPYADKLFLYEKFAPFGAILSVKILTNEEGSSRGVGFVNFSDTACAAKAVAALHNLPLGDRNLHVTFQTHHKT